MERESQKPRTRWFPVLCSVVLAVSFTPQTAFSNQLSTFSALSAEADPHTGSANMAVPIQVPPGRGGIQPNIQLQYNSSSPNGIAGMGWSMEFGSIQRSSKRGVPQYDDTDTFILIQSGGAQELVPDTTPGVYHGKQEGAFMKIERLADHWEVTDKSGVKYYFGETLAAREHDPNDASRVFKWYLNKVQDVFGNVMTHEYLRDGNKLYPQNIYYAGNSQQGLPAFAAVQFEYETRPESGIDRYNTGFKITEKNRLAGIEVYADNILQRRYELNYDKSLATGRSLLASVTQKNAQLTESLPGISFTYQDNSEDPEAVYTIASLTNPAAVGDNIWNYRWGGGFDHGPDNFGPVPPGGFDVSWGPTYTQSSGGNWNSNGNGRLTFSAGQDAAYWFWTYLYVTNAVTLNVPYSTEGVDGVWINGNYSTSVHQTWFLHEGYNLVEMTFYNQNQGFGFDLNYDLAGNVDLMNSSVVTLPQISGDFNADGLSDIAAFTSSSGTVKVSLSEGAVFAPEEVWINGFGSNGQFLGGDFNGDGRVDICVFDKSGGTWQVAMSNGSQFTSSGTWLGGFGNNEEASAGDFNGDGLTDVMTFYKSSGSLYARIALNKGGSFQSAGQTVLVGSESDMPFVGDFNGDGQIDFGAFNKSSGSWGIRLNTGDIGQPFEALGTVSGFGTGKNIVVGDFNYDGLTDLGYYDEAARRVRFKVSKGTSFATDDEFPFTFTLVGAAVQVQAADYNGDTLSDFAAYNAVTGDVEIAYSDGMVPDLLTQVDNGVGGVSSIEYGSLVNSDHTFLPFPIQVIARTAKSNSLGDIYTGEYAYRDGLWDSEGREFRGFGIVRVTDIDGNYSETKYAQDDIYKGRVLEQLTYDSGDNLYSKSVNQWDAVQDIYPGANFVFLKRKDNYVFDGDGTGRRTAEEFFYEETPQLGNLTKAVQLGEVDLSSGADITGDTRIVETEYISNTSGNNWLIGLPRLTTVKDNSGAVVRKTWFNYDNNDNTTPPVKGLLTKKEDWAGDGQQGVNPVTQYTYDSTGNLLTTTDPLNNSTSIVYDTQYNLFPVTTINALGHSVVNQYYGVEGVALDGNGLWGQLKSTTDPNEQEGTRLYDTFGRTIAVISPLDSLAYPTQMMEIEFFDTYTAVTEHKRVNHGEPETIDAVSFYDGLGRLVQTKTRTETTGQYVVKGHTRYNSRGLAEEQYLPFISTNPMNVIDAVDTGRPFTKTLYDAMGRVVRTINPDGTYSTIAYNDWTAIATDENGHKQESDFDAYGRLIEKREYSGSDGRSPYYPAQGYSLYAATQYTYDSEGNLVQTTDAHGNVTTITYDKLGRKISMNDPDMGVWQYTYDANGNLKTQTDAKGQTIVFTYDSLNRLVNKTDAGNLNVDYTYDDPFISNSKGRLTRAEYGFAGDHTQFSYDAMGREIQSAKVIDARGFDVARNYDALSRLANIQYPDGANIVYKYNTAGQLNSVVNDAGILPDPVIAVPELNSAVAGDARVSLSWGSVIGAAGYNVKYGTESGNYGAAVDAGNVTNFTVAGLTNGTSYYFAVTAYNAQDESGNSNERSAAPAAAVPVTMPSPVVHYKLNESASNTFVADSGSAAFNAMTGQDSVYTADLTNGGSASASSCWEYGPCSASDNPPQRSFNNNTTDINGWVSYRGRVYGEWLEYSLPSPQRIVKYDIYPRWQTEANGGANNGGNPRDWTFEGYNGVSWDVLDSQSGHGWTWQSPKIFPIANDIAYSKYRIYITANRGHHNVGLTELDMMGYAPLHTGTVSSSGKINTSFDFNGSSQYVNADALAGISNDANGSIAMWVNPDSLSSDSVILSMGDADGVNKMEVRAAGDLEFHITKSTDGLSVKLPNALAAGTWSHVVIVQDGTSIKGYVNGSEVPLAVTDQSLGLDAWLNLLWGIDNARIGCLNYHNNSNHNFYDGKLDDLRYYNYPLTAPEIEALYNGGAGTEEANPQYYLAKRENTLNSTWKYAKVSRTFASIFASVRDFYTNWFEPNILGIKPAYAQSVDPFEQDSGADGIVSMEAESFHANTSQGNHSWDIVSTSGESGAGSLQALPNAGSNNNAGYVQTSPRLDYEINFVKTGTHYIWIRGMGASGNDDSVHAGLDGQAVSSADRISSFDASWKWSRSTMDSNVASIDVASPGVHTLNLWMREDGVVIDKIVVSSNYNYVPSGLGPDESPRGQGSIQPPAAPVLNSAVPGDGQVSLSWSAVSGADGYRIKYGDTPSHSSVIDVNNLTDYTVTGLTNGTTYYFVVAAYNSAGDSPDSNELTAVPEAPAPPPPPPPSVPSAPVLNSAVPGDGQVELSWNAVAGADGYIIKYGTTSGGGGAADFTQDAGCVAAWKLDETSGAVVDSCGVNHGTRYGTLSQGVSGKYDNAVEFLDGAGGNNAYISFGSDSSLDNLSARTITAWINPHGLGNNSQGRILSKNYQDGWTLHLAANNNIAFSQAFSGGVVTWTTTTNAVEFNTFQHVAVTYAGSGTGDVPTIYLNGVPQPVSGWTPFGTLDNDASYDLKFGIESTTYEFDGVIDEVAIFNRILSGVEIIGIMNNRLDGSAGGVFETSVDAGDVTSFTAGGLTNGTTYYFAVSAYNAAGDSPDSNALSAEPFAEEGGAPVIYVKDVDYNAAGQITRLEYGNGTVTTNTYDQLTLRLTRIYTVNDQAEVLQDLRYTYDSVGNILTVDDYVNTSTQQFQYDALNRLVQAEGDHYGVKTYAYDKIGNIVEKDGKTYSYDGIAGGPHAVTSTDDGFAETTFTYDSNGNMATRQEGSVLTEYVYDVENRLIEVKNNGTIKALYEYDGDGGRTKKIVDGVTTEFIGSIFEKTGARETGHVFLGDMRIASLSDGEVTYYHTDHLGGTNVLTDDTGIKTDMIEYLPFGKKSRHEKYGGGADIAHHYFTGQRLDDETGLYYYGARYYDPSLGRFITPDTLIPGAGNPQAFNRYAYCLNNPVNRVDPSGHWSWKKFWKAAVGAFVGAVACILAGPAGFALVGSTMAGIIGGAVGGAITGGLEGGWRGALMGAAFGGALGGIGGWGVGKYGWGFGAGMLAVGAGVAGATNSWDSFAGGLTGGFLGSLAGSAFIGTEHFQNWKAGNGWQSNAEYSAQQRNIVRMYDMLAEGGHPGFDSSPAGTLTLAANDGHTGMGINNSDLFGKYPANSGVGFEGSSADALNKATWVFGRRTPGVILYEGTAQTPSFAAFPPVRNSWTLNQLQMHMVQNYVAKGGQTFILSANCADWALGAARTAGIHVPNNMSTLGFTDPKHVSSWLSSRPKFLR